jgi:hypothetical protein
MKPPPELHIRILHLTRLLNLYFEINSEALQDETFQGKFTFLKGKNNKHKHEMVKIAKSDQSRTTSRNYKSEK